MDLIGQEVLRRAEKKNVPLRKWLTPWAAAVENKIWSSLNDLQKDYPKADGVTAKSGAIVTVFDVKGNKYRLLTSVDYDLGVVEALEILTHAEYDKGSWKDRY